MIVSTLARDECLPLSPCVDYVFYVKDSHWGRTVPDTEPLSPTAAALVACSSAFVAIVGGDATRDEMLAARQAGKPVTFIPADMHHQIAQEKAQQRGEPAPTDFRGAAHDALAPGNMAAYCRGEAAGQFGTKPGYIKTGKLTRVRGGGYVVQGTADLGAQGTQRFQDTFDKRGTFLHVQ